MPGTVTPYGFQLRIQDKVGVCVFLLVADYCSGSGSNSGE